MSTMPGAPASSGSGTFRVALVGAPNTGKTALFNALTGGRQKVANYPGVTVERKTGTLLLPSGRSATLIDLPGTYSLRARSPDEAIARDVILGRLEGETPPDLLICVADATNLRLTIRLVLELKRVGRPLLLVLNMFDIARKRDIAIDPDRLAVKLGVPVAVAVAVRRGGAEDVLARLDDLTGHSPGWPPENTWRPPTGAELRAAQREADAIVRAVVRRSGADEFTSRLDAVLLHPVAGLVILFAILFAMFQAVFIGAAPAMNLIAEGFLALGALAHDALPAGMVQSFIQDGVIAGVGSVVVFLPQILILFLFILILEDLGYMTRAAFLMDRIMGSVGLHGRAFIPLLSCFACAVPGIMACRVIDTRRDRLATILVAPLITCSARIPVYTLIVAAFVPARQLGGWISLQGLVMFGLYGAGILSALGVSFLFKRFLWREDSSAPFMLELPDYKLPRLSSVALALYARAKMFLGRAGTVIFALTVLVWLLASFPRPPAGATEPAITYSLAAMIGHGLHPVLAPLGFNWQICVALVPGMAAREVAVAALGTVYSIAGGEGAAAHIGQVLAGQWSLATALALLVWYVYAPQCAATLVAIGRETGSWKWPAIAFAYMMALAYLAAFATYHIAAVLGAG